MGTEAFFSAVAASSGSSAAHRNASGKDPESSSKSSSGASSRTNIDVERFLSGNTTAAQERAMTLEFQHLSMQEREHVYHDLHGVSPVLEETQDLLQESLDLYRGYVHAMTQDSDDPRSHSYHLAVQQDASFVQGDWLGLLFLRANEFHAKKAAEALLCHLYLQHTMIGEHAIARVLRQSDMSPQDLEVLQSGVLQLLPRRDSSGRAVIVIAVNYLTKEQLENYRHVMNAMAYLAWKAAMDEETQKRGLVFVQYNIGPFRADIFNPHLVAHIAQVIPGSPLRVAGMHACYSSKLYAPLASLGKALTSRTIRLRTRFHEFDSHLECRYALMTFGLPVQTAWPVDALGNLCQIGRHCAWLQAMAHLEEKTKDNHDDDDDCILVLLPSRFDVLAGRAHVGHAGNLRLKYLLAEHMAEYEEASKRDKTTIINKLVDEIKALGGRFLEEHGGAWKVQSNTEANRRVSSLFRTSRRAVKNLHARLNEAENGNE